MSGKALTAVAFFSFLSRCGECLSQVFIQSSISFSVVSGDLLFTAPKNNCVQITKKNNCKIKLTKYSTFKY